MKSPLAYPDGGAPLAEPVAIVGLGGIFPGAATLDAFWRLIEGGVDTSRPVPPGRWILDPAQIQNPAIAAPDQVYTDRGCFIEGVDSDLSGLDLPAGLIAALDPAVRILLAAGKMAWTSAGLASVDRRRVGLVLGNIALPTAGASAWCERVLLPLFKQRLFGRVEAPPALGDEALNQYVTGLPAGLLARGLGLGGGCYTLDAACASSLYAVKQACDELLAGRADAMLAGGLSRPDSLYTQMGFCQLRALATSGRCAPFDAAASGLIVGEGAGLVVLKRLSDALRDGDRIRAVIRGAGLSNDLDGNLLSPSSEGQLRALRRAYRQAGWSPDQVDFIECHATGTPVGDAVEFASLAELWRGVVSRPGQCVLGAVKANIGHLLTAAGSASLIKTLLAMERGVLPQTANFHQPGPKIPLEGSPFRVLRQNEPWTRRSENEPRRAAINGFGFGGINAHLLIEEWAGQKVAPRAKAKPSAPAAIAIVGLAAKVGHWPDLAAFQTRVLGGGPEETPAERNPWRGVAGADLRAVPGQAEWSFPGYYLSDVDLPIGRYRIPPKELAELLPQQALMLEAASAALADAQQPAGDPARAGVYIGLSLDARTTDFHLRWALRAHAEAWANEALPHATPAEKTAWMAQLLESAGPALTADRTLGALAGVCASRVAKEFHFGGPSHTIGNEECSGLRALEIAVRALQQGELDRALVGAVEIAGDPRALLAAQRANGGTSGNNEFIAGEGAAAVVLKRVEDAQRDGDRVYAVIRGLGTATGSTAGSGKTDAEACREALRRACQEAGIDPGQLGYLEMGEFGGAHDLPPVASALANDLNTSQRTLACHVSQVADDVGHAGAAAGLLALAKAALALRHEILPPCRRAPFKTESGLVAAATPQYWVRNREAGPRRAGVLCGGLDGNHIQVILEGAETASESLAAEPLPLGPRPESLFILRAASPDALRRELAALREAAAAFEGKPLEPLARRWWQQPRASTESNCLLALIAQDAAQVARLAGQADGLVQRDEARLLIADGRDRDRVFYSTTARRINGGLAFVFPGSGNHFAGMGRELALDWPEVLRAQDRENARLASQLHADVFWNAAADAELPRDQRVLICGQVALGAFASDLAKRFGLQPEAAIGYSLGESTALFALRAWTARDEMLRRVTASPLFARDLAGDPAALARAWGLPKNTTVEWQACLIDRPAEAAQAVIGAGEHVYVLIVNTPGECVIGGEAGAVSQVVARLGCHWWPLEGVSTVHCELLKPVEQPYREMHTFETQAPAGVRFYSGGWGKAYTPDRETAAEAIVAQASGRVDFPRVIHAAYESGVRFFLELGPGNSCSRMIGRILEGQPHVARSLCISAQETLLGLLRALGALAAEGLAVDLSPLYGGPEIAVSKSASNKPQICIPIAGAPWLAVPARPQPAGPVRNLESSNAAPVSLTAAPQFSGQFESAPSIHGASVDSFELEVIQAMAASQAATLEAHRQFLNFSQGVFHSLAQAAQMQFGLAAAHPALSAQIPATMLAPLAAPKRAVALDRAACLEFAVGSVARVLGSAFQEVDSFPTRVRLPDEPLMLVDRILEIDAVPRSMTKGRVVTEHDILPGAWYLDCGRIPTCVAVEAGQADLFLSGYLGIDFQTRGLAVYRLLDARVCFHRGLPGPGETIHYDIHIERFFQQSGTWLFHFHFEATVNGQPLLTMTNGCAGFFTAAALAGGRGIVRTAIAKRADLDAGKVDPSTIFVPLAKESYSTAQLDALRTGDLAACFGSQFSNLPLRQPLTLPAGRMRLVYRITQLDPQGGRFGLGLILGEADIRPDDWFLTCHFVDDRVMPGTLMYECCLHTLRVYLLRMGWVVEAGQAVLEPVPGIPSQLKCRGQVLESTAKVTYEISIKELGFRPEPYVVADALMYADGKPIVEIAGMNLRYSGVTLEMLSAIWSRPAAARQVLYDRERITAFAIGKPSEAFGEAYRVFDGPRRIARLPGPPFQFLDRIVHIEQAEAFKLAAGGVVEAEYDVPPDEWYFAANLQGDMPFSVLLEIALQPCGWLAAYMGSALASAEDLSFRNLGGSGTQFVPVWPNIGTLTTRVKMTRLSSSAGMILQWFDFEVRAGAQRVYQGDTYFGFFPQASLLRQEGIKNAERWQPAAGDLGQAIAYPTHLVGDKLRMIDRVEGYLPNGGPQGLGFIRGTKTVRPEEWFFKAHFYQDPVTPGSLGLESFLQLLKYIAFQRWGRPAGTRCEAVAIGAKHEWVYRGQIVPDKEMVTVEAVVTRVDNHAKTLVADGLLSVDGKVIYAMKDFMVRQSANGAEGRKL